ncbi:MAG: phage major capsid protein, partial [Chloroflexi bacterium]|nr:phage major capsid protein [Chloroflexota bacterium]
ADNNPNQPDGLAKRIANDLHSSCLINAATGGATLTLDMMDQLIDSVTGESTAGKHLFLNKTLRRKITSLVNAATGSRRIDYKADSFGRQVMHYNDVPIHIMEHDNDASTILGFTENDGSGNLDTASSYCVRFGDEDYVFGLSGGDSSIPSVQDFGELQTSPNFMGRIEWYLGLAIAHPRAASRLCHINNA